MQTNCILIITVSDRVYFFFTEFSGSAFRYQGMKYEVQRPFWPYTCTVTLLCAWKRSKTSSYMIS